jgi:uridine kinase
MPSHNVNAIHISQPRDTIRVTFPDNLVLEGAVGSLVEDFLCAAQKLYAKPFDAPIMGAIVNNRLRELAYPINWDSQLEAVLLSSSDGGRIYRRSLVMLLATAAGELWEGIKVKVGYAVPDGGFYCQLINREPLNASELAQLEAHMRTIVAADDPITKQIAPLNEAVQLFTDREDYDKVRLLEQRTRNELTLYTLRNYTDYYFGYMVSSTGCLQTFRLHYAGDGFILQYPRKESPHSLDPILVESKLNQVFQLADKWLYHMGIEDVGRLNRVVRENRIQELILVAEALHEQRIAQIASEIWELHENKNIQVVLIAGPSSSGKTTFAKRLAIQLLAHGLRPFTLELDNYFVDRHLTPRDEKGEYNFESLEAVNRALFNEHLLRLIAGETVRLPRFDFVSGSSTEGELARLQKNQIIIIEGIHGLNPALVPDIPPEVIYRIYVSALTQLNIDTHNRVPTTDVRLLRRIVRDARHRGNDATATLERWQSVRRGEKRNIFPYQENADAMFNSALVYELAALRPLVEPLLLQVKFGTRAHIEANRLLSFLGWVQPFTPEQTRLIPDTSLLREFIGDSILHDYHPYHPYDG